MVACMMVSVRGSHKHLPQLPGISYVGALETSKALSQILKQNSQHYWVHLKHDEIQAVEHSPSAGPTCSWLVRGVIRETAPTPLVYG